MNNDNFNLNQIKEFLSFYSNNTYLNEIINSNIYNSYITKYKNGKKIHIKKKNKGLFTKYCKGKVTDECIKRGKNSSNSIIRKRAIFADNSRRFFNK